MRDSFAVMRFDHHTLVRLEEADEIEMRTPRLDGSTSARPIWVVVVDGSPYVRSYQGERGAWYRRARADGRAQLGVDGEDVAVSVVPAAGGDLDDRVSDAYRAKYGRRAPGPTEAMLTPPVVATTLRLEPAADG
jgi:hypothetical protein